MSDGQDVKIDRRKWIELASEGLQKGWQRDHFVRLLVQLESDDEALIILKGQLVIEERITAAIEKFVFNPEYLEKARLSFADKLAIARSMSLEQSKNPMWKLIEKLNALRNKLSHSLESESRAKAMNALKILYIRICGGKLDEDEQRDNKVWLAGAVALCLGFVAAFEQEVQRFKGWVAAIDLVANPQRHSKK